MKKFSVRYMHNYSSTIVLPTGIIIFVISGYFSDYAHVNIVSKTLGLNLFAIKYNHFFNNTEI